MNSYLSNWGCTITWTTVEWWCRDNLRSSSTLANCPTKSSFWDETTISPQSISRQQTTSRSTTRQVHIMNSKKQIALCVLYFSWQERTWHCFSVSQNRGNGVLPHYWTEIFFIQILHKVRIRTMGEEGLVKSVCSAMGLLHRMTSFFVWEGSKQAEILRTYYVNGWPLTKPSFSEIYFYRVFIAIQNSYISYSC